MAQLPTADAFTESDQYKQFNNAAQALAEENARLRSALEWIAREATHKHIRDKCKEALGKSPE